MRNAAGQPDYYTLEEKIEDHQPLLTKSTTNYIFLNNVPSMSGQTYLKIHTVTPMSSFHFHTEAILFSLLSTMASL